MKIPLIVLSLALSLVTASPAMAGYSEAKKGKIYTTSTPFMVKQGGFMSMGTGCITLLGIEDASVLPSCTKTSSQGKSVIHTSDTVEIKKDRKVSGDFGRWGYFDVISGRVKVVKYNKTGGGCPDNFGMR